MQNISFEKVSINHAFWRGICDRTRLKTIPAVRRRFEESGRFAALAFEPMPDGLTPHVFFDSDTAKWIEGVSWAIMESGDPMEEQQEFIDRLVQKMEAHQREDGYLNSYFQRMEPDAVFTRRSDHELYCAGHLIEAAVAYKRATGKRKFLDVMLRFTDCIERAFVTEKTAKFVTPGHEEIEYALLLLYEETGDKRHLELARFFLLSRGRQKEDDNMSWVNARYNQSDRPICELEDAEGHAVRAVYLYMAMSEYALLENDREVEAACKRLYDSICRRMYITGGIGSARSGEAFTVDFDLPNLTAYAESCAAIALLIFSANMQRFGRDSRYADTVERILYNSLLSSTSLDGIKFFYENPLEICRRKIGRETSLQPQNQTIYPITQRVELFSCSCCPPNICRIFPKIGGLVFSEDERGLLVNQYISCSYGSVRMTTDYPVSGTVRFEATDYAHSEIAFRKPWWCRSCEIKVNGNVVTATEENDYLCVKVGANFTAELTFDVRPIFWESCPEVVEDAGKVALSFGPIVCCLEEVDNGENLSALSVDIKAPVRVESDPVTGLVRLVSRGWRDESFDETYREAAAARRETELIWIPYFAFANRGESDMAVWVRKG